METDKGGLVGDCCLARGLEKNLFACVISHRIVGLIYLTLKQKILYKGLEIKFLATVRGRTGDQTEPPYPAPKGVGTFLIAGTWMLWKSELPSVKDLSLDSEIAARGFYESIGFQPRGLAGYTLKSPKGHLLKAILMLANNCNDPLENVFQEIRKAMEKQIYGLRKKAKNKKEKSARRAVITSVKECLGGCPRTAIFHPAAGRQTHPAAGLKILNVFLRLIPLKRDAFLDLATNFSFSDNLLITE